MKSIYRTSLGYAKITIGSMRHRISGPAASRMVFVLGTGRSGTHWLGYILEKHDDVHVNIEQPPLFGWVAHMANLQNFREKMLPRVINAYRSLHSYYSPKHFIEKTHPNIWLAEELHAAFDNALFIGIRRDVHGTVSSMLNHKGVMAWIHNWESYDVPNPFLGITNENVRRYPDMPLEEKCTLRWISHAQRLERLEKSFGDRIMVVDYSTLQENTLLELERIQKFIGLSSPIPVPEIRRASLEKWRDVLTANQIRNISRVVVESIGESGLELG